MRVIVLGEAEREAARKLLEFAAKPANLYVPMTIPRPPPPGHDHRHVMRAGLYGEIRVVFSYTETPQGLYRHMTLSMDGGTDLPEPELVFEIARLLGFDGEPRDWAIELGNEALLCVAVAQKIGEVTVNRSDAPWTDDQVASLNGYQNAGYVHPFTIGNGHNLIATPAGWVEVEGGPVVQTWAHEFMTNWSWQWRQWPIHRR